MKFLKAQPDGKFTEDDVTALQKLFGFTRERAIGELRTLLLGGDVRPAGEKRVKLKYPDPQPSTPESKKQLAAVEKIIAKMARENER
jgi:hypothetical protein